MAAVDQDFLPPGRRNNKPNYGVAGWTSETASDRDFQTHLELYRNLDSAFIRTVEAGIL